MTEARDNTYQDRMDDIFVKEYGDVLMGDKTLESFLDDWGYSKEELDSYLDSRPDLMDKLPRDFDLPNANVDNFSGINPEWEGEGVTSEMLPGDSAIADSITWLAEKAGVPPEAALAVAGIVGKNPKKAAKGIDGMLTKDMPKSVVLKPGQKKPTTKQIRDLGKNQVKTIKKNKAQAEGSKSVARAKDKEIQANKDKAIQVATIPAAATAINLMGNRDKDGSFTTADSNVGNKYPEGEEFYTEPEVDLNAIARGDDSIGVTEPEGEDKEERPGWKIADNGNFWTVNTESPYWQTEEGALEAEGIYGERPAWVKQEEKEEINWAKLFG